MNTKTHFKFLQRVLLSFAIFLTVTATLGSTMTWATPAPQQELEEVWQRVARSGAYGFRADMTQTATPQATVVNAGRSNRESTLYMEGTTDVQAELLHLTLWTDGGSVLDPASGMEIRVEGDRAQARRGSGPWEEIDDFTGIFAPGGDFMAYVKAAENVVRHAPEPRNTPLGAVEVTRYTFDINGRDFAMQMHEQMREQAMRDGLPAHVRLELPRVYAEMRGTGELWVGSDGLPLRQIFDLEFPPDQHDYVTSAAMTIDFFDFAPIPTTTAAYRIGHTLDRARVAMTTGRALATWALAALGLLFICVIILRRRSRYVYATAALLVIVSMVITPLLTSQQLTSYSVAQAAKAARQNEDRTQRELQAEMREPRVAPHANPLQVAHLQEENTPVSRYPDPLCESDPAGDADGDTLTNLEECLLGTLVDVVDTDQDGAPDNVEVAGVVLKDADGVERTWYTDPLTGDTNNDGLSDGKEWLLDTDGNGVPEDTDGNGIPDMWDDDNDGDGVRDQYDLSPYHTTQGAQTFNGDAPLALSLNDLVDGELVKVEFQLRPTDASHLWYSQNILDWPHDTQGQIQDADGKTFYDVDNSVDPNPNANGDMRLVPMLEIEISGSETQLPPEDLLSDFGIALQEVVTDTTYMAYVPLQLVSDSTGDANLAFYGRMYYQPSGTWETAHNVRMVWVVQVLNDTCIEYTNSYCSAYDPDQMNQLQVVQTYDDDWYLSGLHVTEDHSADIALIYEDPAVTGSVADAPADYDKPLYLDTLYGLLYGLDKTFLAGSDCGSGSTCTPDGSRDMTVDTIYTRFNHATNSGVSDTERWNLPNVLTVEKNEYDSIDLGMLDTTITQTVAVLDNAFTNVWSASDPITPTVMYAYEQSYRSLNLDEMAVGSANLAWNGNGLTVNFFQSGDNAVGIDTLATVKWTPYAYDPATGWGGADINSYYDGLETLLAPTFAGITDPDEANTYQTMTQIMYLTAYGGDNSLVEIDGEVLSQEHEEPDEPIYFDLSKEIGEYMEETIKTWFEFQELYEKWENLTKELNSVADYQRSGGNYTRVNFQADQEAWNEVEGIPESAAGIVLIVVWGTALIIEYATHNAEDAEAAEKAAGAAPLVIGAIGIYSTIKSIRKVAQSLVKANKAATFGEALNETLTDSTDVLSASDLFPFIGLLLSIGVAVGMFIYAVASGDVHKGTVEYNELVAHTIVAVMVALILFVLTTSVIGLILVALVGLIDGLLALIGVDWSITGWLTDAIASVLYRFDMLISDPDVESGQLENELTAPDDGLTGGNSIQFTLPLTTTLSQIPATGIYGLGPLLKELLANSFVYEMDPEATTLSTNAGDRKDDWNVTQRSNGLYTLQVEDEPDVTVPLQAGINRDATFYLNSAYAVVGYSCWLAIFCNEQDVTGHSSTLASDGIVFDVFPATLDAFLDTSTASWNQGAIRAVDVDGDGLLASRYGGLDPDDTNWDVDGDGLSDAYELTIRSLPAAQGGENLSPLIADGDNDFISDGDELRWGTNPDSDDTDGDGILDIQEIGFLIDAKGDLVFGGWSLPYSANKSTRAWSDPLSTDVDGDGLSDLFERTEDTCPTCAPWADPNNPVVFNPRVWNVSPVALYPGDSSVDGYVAPGETIIYTTTTANNLSGGQELVGDLSLRLPGSFNLSGGALEQPVDISSGGQQSLLSTITAIDTSASVTGALVSTMRLTDFETTTWAWDAPIANSTIPTASVQALAATAVSEWSQPGLLVTTEITADGTPHVVGYLANSNEIVGAPHYIFHGDSGDTLTAPAIACMENGACLVVVGVNATDTPGQLWSIWLDKRFPDTPPTQLVWAAETNIAVSPPTIASNGTDFLVGWATADGQGYVDYVSAAGIPNPAINPTALPATQPSNVALSLDGKGYLASWVESGTLQRAAVGVTTGITPTVTVGAATPMGAGAGWPTGAPVRQVYDPISRQALLLYRSSDARLHGRLLSTTSTSDAIEIDAGVGDDLSGSGVQTALCADPKNSGWIAAWSSPADDTRYYRAIGPDGTLRGEAQAQPDSGVPLALLCNAAQPMLDLEFDESSGSTEFIDDSAFAQNATCAGSCPEADVGGRFGNAVRFNGTDAALRIPNSENFNFAADQDFTVSFWVIADANQPTQTTSDNDIVEKWSGSGGYPFAVRYNRATGTVWGLRYDGTHNPAVASASAIDDGEFHHVAFIKRGGYLYLYIDGEQSGPRVPDTTTGDTTNTSALYLGKRGDDTNHFAGTLDALRIYNRALSNEEIGGVFDAAAAIYDLDEVAGSQVFVDASGNELNGVCTGTACPTMGVPGVAYTAAQFDGQDDYIQIESRKRTVATYRYDFEAGVGSEWRSAGILEIKFDEGSGATTFADATGSGHDATCSDATCPSAGNSGHSGNAITFDGLTQYAIVKNSSAFNFTSSQDFTVAFWVQVDEQQDLHQVDNSIVEKWGNYGGYPFVVRLNRGPGTVAAGRTDGQNNPYVSSTARIDDGAFHHVAFVRRAANLYLYIDGVQSGDSVFDTTTGDTTNTSDLVLGMRGGGTNHFAGSLDDLRIFAYGMSAQDIAALFSSGQSHGTQMNADDGFPDNPLGNYYLGLFANETVQFHLTELPPHDTVKVNYDLIATLGRHGGWDGNSTDGGPDNWEWGHADTSASRTNFNTQPSYDVNTGLPTGNYQAYPAPASDYEGQPGGYFTMCNVPQSQGNARCGTEGDPHQNLLVVLPESADLAVDMPPPGAGDNPGDGEFSNEHSDTAVVRTFTDPNFGGTSTTFDSYRVHNELHDLLPSGTPDTGVPPWPASVVSSYKTWKSAYQPRSGSIYFIDFGGSGVYPEGVVYPLDGSIPDHTTDDLTLYFKGETSLDDPTGNVPEGPERWGLDNVEITLEQDDTSIPFNNSSFTVAAWAKRAVEGKNMFILSQGKEEANQGLHFGFRESNVFTCAFSADDLNTAPVAWDHEWHHWVCTYDVSTNTRTVYRDGVQIGQDTPAAPLTASGPTIIGAYLDKTDGFQGEIDEVGIWRKALSADAVMELYNKIKVEDQSVMVAILVTTDGTGSTFRTDTLVLRETATRAGTITQDVQRVLTIDADKPVVCADAAGADAHCPPPDQYVNSVGSLVISGVAADPTSYISQVEVNPGSGFIPATGTGTWSYAWDIGGLRDGEQSLPVRAMDAVGNVSAVYDVKIIVDRTPPAVTVDQRSPERALRNAQGRWLVPLSGTVSDPKAGSKPGSGIAGVEVLLDGAGELAGLAWQPVTIADGKWTIDYELPTFGSSGQSLASPTGVYTVSVRATDRISNTTAAGDYTTSILTLDQDGPAVTQTDPPAQVTSIQHRFTLKGQASDLSAVTAVEVNLTPAEQVDALSGTTLYLPFDDILATEYFADASGSGNAATCSGSACPTITAAGKQGSAITLNGTHQALVIPNSADINFAHDQEFSVAFWVRVGTQVDTENGDNDIVEKWSDVGSYPFAVRLDRATGRIIGARFDGSHNPTILSADAVDDGHYHHVAFIKRGGSLYLYIDGVQSGDPVPDNTTGDTTNDSPLYLGMRGNTGNYFAGTLDDLLIYNRALADYEVADLIAYSNRTWHAATLDNGNWTYTIPEGENGLEGYYQINVRGTDSLGNVTPLGEQRVWRGEIDTKPPDVQFIVSVDKSGNTPSTKYECIATDFNLLQESDGNGYQTTSCVPGWGPPPVYRNSDLTLTTYDQVDAWYAATITDTSRLYKMVGVVTYEGAPVQDQSITACDRYNHCTTVDAQDPLPVPVSPIGAELLSPRSGTVFTGTETLAATAAPNDQQVAVLTEVRPITLVGDAHAQGGLHTLAVSINGRVAHRQMWETADVTAELWRFQWTPPGEGIYRFEAMVDDWVGKPLPAGNAAVGAQAQPNLDTAAPQVAGPPAHLAQQIYLPWAVISGGASSGGLDTASNFYLPLMVTEGEASPVTGAFTGTVATLYVDLTPPQVALSKRAWTGADARNERLLDLTGTVSDSVRVHQVDVRIDDGPWHRAGVNSDGTWRWPWIFATAPDGESFQVTVRAIDLAGHTAQVTEMVTVDTVPPQPGAVRYSYVTTTGETHPMQPGEQLPDAVSFQVSWDGISDGGGPVQYAAGFTSSIDPDVDALTAYDGPGSHSQPARSGERWYASVRYVDDAGNSSTVTVGPFSAR